MKYCHPHAPQTIVPAERRQQRESPDQLHKERSLEDEPRQAHDAAHRRSGNGILHGAALLQRDVSAGEHQKRYSRSDHAQPADLDQQQDDGLTEAGPVAAGVLYHQSRHADRRGGGKQRLVKRRPCAAYGGDGQHQHQRAQQDDARKAQDHDLKGRQAAFQMETGFCHGTHLLKSTAFPIARTV